MFWVSQFTASILRAVIAALVVAAVVGLPSPIHGQVGAPQAAQTAPAAGTAPTASEDPALLDRAWQKASAKYEGARGAKPVARGLGDLPLP